MAIEKFLLTGLKADLPPQRDANKLYWCSDTRELYKGMDLYTEAVRVVSALPAEMAQGVLYILPSGEVKVFDGNQTITVAKPYVTSDNGTKTLSATNTDDEVATAKMVYDSIAKAVGDVVKGGEVVNNIISTKAGTITVCKGEYVQLEASATFDQNTNYFVKNGDSYAVAKVDASTFATMVGTGLYVSADETDVPVSGVVTNPTYDATARKITLPYYDAEQAKVTNLEINLGKDIFVDPTAQNGYNATTKNIELYLNNGDGTNAPTKIEIPASGLIDIYTGATHADGSATVDVSTTDNTITATVNVSAAQGNTLSKNADGLFVDSPTKAQHDAVAASLQALDAQVNGATIKLKENGAATTNSYTFNADDTFVVDGVNTPMATQADLTAAIADVNTTNIEVTTVGTEDRIAANASAIADLKATVEDASFVQVAPTEKFDANVTYFTTDADGEFVVDNSVIDDATLATAANSQGGLFVMASDAIDILSGKVDQNTTDIAANAAAIVGVGYMQCTANTVYDSTVSYYEKDATTGAYVTHTTVVDADTFAAAVAAGTVYMKTTDAVAENEERIAAIESSLTWGDFK